MTRRMPRVLAMFCLAGLLLAGTPCLAQWFEEEESAPAAGTPRPHEKEVGTEVRGCLTVRLLKFDVTDWNCDPTALPYLVYQYRERTGLPAVTFTEALALDSKEIFEWPFIYFTSHEAFRFRASEVTNLRKYLLKGGILWGDDCLPAAPSFSESFRREMKRVLPEHSFEVLKPDRSPLKGICRLGYPHGNVPQVGQPFDYPFEAILIQGRPVVILDPNDYGCHWEITSPPTAANPLGRGAHEVDVKYPGLREKVYRFSINLMLYLQTH